MTGTRMSHTLQDPDVYAALASGQGLLTIVVPAWKPDYLEQALASIAAQTDPRFSVVIFDDAAPARVREIANRFPAFDYVRFDDNLGSRDLVGHWNRCLERVRTDWVWLFSDDDVMSPNCVAEFYQGLAGNPDAVLFQFSVTQVGDGLEPIRSSRAARHESANEFLRARMCGAKLSCVPDHVFNWSELKRKTGGFVNFPLAWNADDATWLCLAREQGIAGLERGEVLWRQSDQNISASSGNAGRKLEADVMYLAWLRRMRFRVSYIRRLRWLAARIAFVYGLDGAGTRPVLARMPAWLWPAVPLAKIYPALRSGKAHTARLRTS